MFTKPPKPYPNLKEKRQKLGLNRAELARMVGVSHRTITRAEEGGPVRDDIYRWIDEALNG